jgi:hypothetical protein
MTQSFTAYERLIYALASFVTSVAELMSLGWWQPALRLNTIDWMTTRFDRRNLV